VPKLEQLAQIRGGGNGELLHIFSYAATSQLTLGNFISTILLDRLQLAPALDYNFIMYLDDGLWARVTVAFTNSVVTNVTGVMFDGNSVMGNFFDKFEVYISNSEPTMRVSHLDTYVSSNTIDHAAYDYFSIPQPDSIITIDELNVLARVEFLLNDSSIVKIPFSEAGMIISPSANSSLVVSGSIPVSNSLMVARTYKGNTLDVPWIRRSNVIVTDQSDTRDILIKVPKFASAKNVVSINIVPVNFDRTVIGVDESEFFDAVTDVFMDGDATASNVFPATHHPEITGYLHRLTLSEMPDTRSEFESLAVSVVEGVGPDSVFSEGLITEKTHEYKKEEDKKLALEADEASAIRVSDAYCKSIVYVDDVQTNVVSKDKIKESLKFEKQKLQADLSSKVQKVSDEILTLTEQREVLEGLVVSADNVEYEVNTVTNKQPYDFAYECYFQTKDEAYFK